MIFDQFSRYSACAQLLRHAIPNVSPSILDVGSGPECLLGQFLGNVEIFYVDPLISDDADENCIRGNVFSETLYNREFNAVTAVDVLEHVPPGGRAAFLERLSLLATDVLVLGFPNADSPDPIQTDLAIDGQYRAVYGVEYPWLKEHHEYGLPTVTETCGFLQNLGWHCQTVGHGHAPWLRELLGFVLCVWENPAYMGLVFALSERFNKGLVGYDFTRPFYRQFVVATRRPIAPLLMPQTLFEFDQANAIFRQLMDDAWAEYFKLSLNNLAQRDAEIIQRDAEIAQRDAEIAQRDAEIAQQIARREAEVAMLKQIVATRESQLEQYRQSLSWRITSPLRFMLRTLMHRGLAPNDKKYLSSIFRRLPGLRQKLKLSANQSKKCFTVPPRGTLADQPEGIEDIFVWAVIDWHFRLQRPQQLARELAATGRRVFYFANVFVDDPTSGFSLESLDQQGRLFQIGLHVAGGGSIYAAPPTYEQLHQLRAGLAAFLEWSGSGRVVNLVQHPFWYEVASVLPNSRLVYDCMDHHEGFGNVSPDMLSLERTLVEKTELLVITSQWLDDELAGLNCKRKIIRNACQYEHFAEIPASRYEDLAGRKIIGYYGAIAEWFDLALVESVAKAFPDCLVLLVGADTCNAKAALSGCLNVIFTGEVPYGDLPYYLHAFDVCLLPFHVVPLTLATNPVKLYEYLSAGKTVVAIDLPEMHQFGELIHIASTQGAFIHKVRTALNVLPTPDEIKRRKDFAAKQTWSIRSNELIQAIDSIPEQMVSVIVVTFNNLELTKACLHSLETFSDYSALEIIVVDNASSDDSPAFLLDWSAKAPGRKLILNKDNQGFAAANNQGLAIAGGDYLVLLNNDTYVTPGWVRTMRNHLRRDSSIGVLGPVTNNIGNEARVEIGYESMSEMLNAALRYTRGHIGQIFPLRTAAFFCVMLPRSVYERVGPLDEAFGRGFFEDDDYCRRVEQQGLRIVCAEDVFVHHHLSASFNKLKDQERQALFERNKAIYESKWGKWIPHNYRESGAMMRSEGIKKSTPDAFKGWQFRTGRCNICGQETRFFYTDASLWREQLACGHCRTTSRYRSIARGILRAIRELHGIEAQSLVELPRKGGKNTLRVYDTQPPFRYVPCAYPLPDLLKDTGWVEVALSQYKPNLPLGKKLSRGVTNQNLECLTFPDASLDIVITSDVMEHVRLDDRAHREIHRVLRPGGIYIFTVPHNEAWDKTLVRVQVNDPDDPSKDVHLLEPEYHGDTNSEEGEGVLSYRVYGKDIEMFLSELGFAVEYTREDFPDQGIFNTELYYCRKLHESEEQCFRTQSAGLSK